MNASSDKFLKAEFIGKFAASSKKDRIYEAIDNSTLTGNNAKYMKMYDWMSRGYDFAENVIGRIKYGNSINAMRAEIMPRLEWKNNASVLYVSIGTGKNLQFIPAGIDRSTLDMVGIDISMGMLGKCRKKIEKGLHMELVQACAENLPFKDEVFDIVFHVGGINFFNEPGLAIEEMIRVAKPGSKMVIADETSFFIEQQYKKSKLSKKYFENQQFDLTALENNIPQNVKEKKTELIWNNKFYCISFRKQ
jgi:ubiquinone/menaquinone biosynthesis C-methylase UbiE